MKASLAIDLTIPAGREVEAARKLHQALPPAEWAILAAFAAEIVHEHELRTGSTVVVVAGSAQAERVLADLSKL
ncbi:MAG TPA: hypothetical protein VFB75_14050 [Burkholderiales bacterium]|nr:hypothetical protein [Burkholderiales bacterium]